MREGVTEMSQRIHTIHTVSLWICIVIGIIVFGAMAYTIYAHRRSKHPEPADFHEHLGVEIIWTIIPVLILAGLAVPAAKTLIDIEDNSNASMTVLITGSQWKWHYQYLDADIDYYSNLATPTTQINSCLIDLFCDLPDEQGIAKPLRESNENYLLEVDKPLVLPANRKVRFLMTSNDVIHSWWVPDFAVKQDALPGFINEAWANVPEPGTYRGQCTELCGKDHAYMPVVVDVRPEAEFDQWVEDQRIAKELASGQAVADREKTWSLAELMEIGEGVYSTHCATCHQPNGEGQGTTYP
ncbi:MAG TPA: cytochrome c oxidase subunit II, partial [Gammaproteobacteria bacterium]|nr:cytochrome c oxidase subunit II [Gammaproteobacteria bacterium]